MARRTAPGRDKLLLQCLAIGLGSPPGKIVLGGYRFLPDWASLRRCDDSLLTIARLGRFTHASLSCKTRLPAQPRRRFPWYPVADRCTWCCWVRYCSLALDSALSSRQSRL